jgi:Carboxypeptidase regulatory-like domain
MSRVKAMVASFAVGALGLMLVPTLATAGTIEGEASDAGSSEPIAGVHVCAYGPTEGCALTGAGGEYSLSGLGAGSYKVEFNAVEAGLDYITQYYDGQSSYEKADPVSVGGGSTAAGIDAALEAGGLIAGTVTDASSEEPIEGVEVCAFVIGTDNIHCAATDAAGEYTVIGLPTDDAYKVEFAVAGYVTQFYDGKPSWFKGNFVAVTAPETTSGIDAQLEAVPSQPAALVNPFVGDLGKPIPPILPAAGSPRPDRHFACAHGRRRLKAKGKHRCGRKAGSHRRNAR